MFKKFFYSILIVILGYGAYDLWNMKVNFNFGEVTPDKVYKSGAMEFDLLKERIEKYNIKTVIDLRDEVSDRFFPADEKKVLDKVEHVNYVNIKSPQVGTKENFEQFFEIMDNKENYPVLIHCYHGLGRTMLYVALYRIEYEGMSIEEARSMTRWYPEESFIYDSSFAKGKLKGDFLINYVPRSEGEKATINTMEK